MKDKHIQAHMRVAVEYAKESYCVRRKVGCIIVKNDSIIAIGWNGTPSGEENVCEINNVTKPNVIHAEDNALRKLTKSTESAVGSYVFITTAPCYYCAVRLADAGVVKVFYLDKYNNSDGIDYLRKRKIKVKKIKLK